MSPPLLSETSFVCAKLPAGIFSVHIYIENIAVVWIIRILFSLLCWKPITAKDL